jgi:hypothetical protein
MAAGSVEIVHDDLPGCILVLTEHDTLVIDNVDEVVCLACSDRAAATLRRLTSKAERMMLAC